MSGNLTRSPLLGSGALDLLLLCILDDVVVDVDLFLAATGVWGGVGGSGTDFCGDLLLVEALELGDDKDGALTIVDGLLAGGLSTSFLATDADFLGEGVTGFFGEGLSEVLRLLLFSFSGNRDVSIRSLDDESESEDDDELLDLTLAEDFATLSRKGKSFAFCLSPTAMDVRLEGKGLFEALLLVAGLTGCFGDSVSLSESEEDPESEPELLLEVLELDKSTATDFLRSTGFFVVVTAAVEGLGFSSTAIEDGGKG